MIQRIQSLYFLIASLLLCFLSFAPIYKAESEDFSYSIFLGGLCETELPNGEPVVLVSQPGLIAVNLIIAALCFASIFLFKNRKLQKRLSSSLMISTAAFVILLSASSAELMKSVPAGNVEGSLSWGLVMPALAIVFLLLANRGINKDEELIKSADRLR
jgi:hypothetical protein